MLIEILDRKRKQEILAGNFLCSVKKKRRKEIDFFLFRFRLKRRHQRYCIIIKIAVNYCFTSQ